MKPRRARRSRTLCMRLILLMTREEHTLPRTVPLFTKSLRELWACDTRPVRSHAGHIHDRLAQAYRRFFLLSYVGYKPGEWGTPTTKGLTRQNPDDDDLHKSGAVQKENLESPWSPTEVNRGPTFMASASSVCDTSIPGPSSRDMEPDTQEVQHVLPSYSDIGTMFVGETHAVAPLPREQPVSLDPPHSQPLPPPYHGTHGSSPSPPELEGVPPVHQELPPSYPIFQPTKFSIGLRTTAPLITVPELQAHLRLLGAFDLLRHQVRRPAARPDGTWAVFLTRSVHRFKVWSRAIIPSSYTSIPPLDVLMVWHAYLLNPRAYHEDGLRYAHRLLGFKDFPIEAIASLISPSTLLPLPPTETRKAIWESLTNLPYEAPMVTVPDVDMVSISCPECKSSFETPWVKTDGSGYAQRQFSAICPACNNAFNREVC